MNGLSSELERLHADLSESGHPADEALALKAAKVKDLLEGSPFIQVLKDGMGTDLLSVSIGIDRLQHGDGKRQRRDVVVFILTTDINIRDAHISAFIDGPCSLHTLPAETMRLGCQLEDLRLRLTERLTPETVKHYFRELRLSVERSDVADALRMSLLTLLAQTGNDAETFAVNMMRRLEEARRDLDRHSTLETVRNLLLNREIMRRLAILKEAADLLKDEEDVSFRMVHVDVLRRAIFDGKLEFINECARGAVFDRGFVGGLAASVDLMERVRAKFEDHYFIGYWIFGSWVTRPESAGPTTDLDACVLIDDFDVKKMGRVELKSRLQDMIANMATQTALEAGLEGTRLHLQILLFSEVWQAIYEGEVVMLSMLEEGLVLYDPRSLVRTWQILLRGGGIAPSRSTANQLLESARRDVFFPYRRIREAVVDDLYPGMLAVAQCVLVKLGERVLPPDTVIHQLREYAKKADNGFASAAELEEVAAALVECVRLYRALKTQPSMQITPHRLGQLMRQSQKAFAVADAICERLGDSRLETIRLPPIIGPDTNRASEPAHGV